MSEVMTALQDSGEGKQNESDKEQEGKKKKSEINGKKVTMFAKPVFILSLIE